MLRDVYKHFDPMVLRYYFLTHHYRMPIEFSFEGLTSAQKSYERLIRLFDVDPTDIDTTGYRSDVIDRIMEFLKDDLNTPGLFGVIFEHMTDLACNTDELAAIKNIMINVLGLTLQPLPLQTIAMTPEIESLITERNKARQEKNWARADELRDQLQSLGVNLHDGKI
jgi:cysteinyl-tRNA synthetase